MKPKANGFYHMAVAKRLMRLWIEKDGPQAVLSHWTGTKEEALTALENDPREVFTPAGCDNYDEKTGECKGHEEI